MCVSIMSIDKATCANKPMMLLFNLPMYKSIYPQAVHRVQIERSINNWSSLLPVNSARSERPHWAEYRLLWHFII